MNFRPLGDRIMIEVIQQEETMVSGIIIPAMAQEKPCQGRVVAVGPGGLTESGNVVPMNVKVGEIVIYGKYAGQEVKIEGKPYVIIREQEVFGVYN